MAVMMDVLFGPYRGQRIMMPEADAAQAIADGWAVDPHAPPAEPPFDLSMDEHRDHVYVAAHVGSEKLRAVGSTPAPAAAITSLAPASCTIGDPDFTLIVNGTGFTATSVIHFAGHDEPTTLNADDTLSTGVKPSLWGAPAVVQCSVRNGAVSSNEVDFEFLAPVTRSRSTMGGRA